MARKVDPEVLAGFIEEAKGYLPKILQGVDAFQARPSQGETLEEAHRHAHTIKGAASMVGLNGLSTMANHLEECFEELMTADRLPQPDEAAALLREIVAQIELFLEGKSNGGVREKPLLEEVSRIYEQLRSMPTEDRFSIPASEHIATSDTENGPIDIFSSRLQDLRGWLTEAVTGAQGDVASIRQPFEALQAEAARLGRAELADSLQRLGLMTEVWECLAADGPEPAAEVAAFCDRALEYLANCGRSADTDEDASWIVEESSERWGEYLALLEPGGPGTSEEDDSLAYGEPQADRDDAGVSFDAGALLRMLAGDAGSAEDLAPAPARWATTFPAESLPPAASLATGSEESDSEDGGAEDASTELREVFALEAEDHLRELSTLLPALEREPENKRLLQDIRRSAHTLKGSAAMVGLPQITQLAHRMEDLLDLLYEGSRAVTPEIVRLLFASTDALEDMVAGKVEPDVVHELYASYSQLIGSPAEEELAPAPAPAPLAAAMPKIQTSFAPPVINRALAQVHAERRDEARSRPPQVPAVAESEAASAGAEGRKQNQFVRFPIDRLDELVKLLGELVITRTFLEQRMADLVRQVGELEHSSNRLRGISSKLETQYEASTLSSSNRLPFGPVPGNGRVTSNGYGNGHGNGNGNGAGHHNLVTSQTHGFDDLEFDRYTEFHLLTRSLSETTSDIQTVSGELSGLIGDFDSYLNRQARLSSEVEDKLMRSRMVPLATLASRLHRTVRNVANQQGKVVDLVLEGESTELDKTVLEEMADPLLHLLRNSVDHGIESAEVREAIGKPGRGTIRLRADYVGSQVVIQISDDGAGLDPETIRSTALARGFVTSADAAKMTDSELFSLVYLPGFSTAQQISEVSGRGVGLDIVKANVHKLKGTLHLDSRVGHGVTFTIRLPMTLAVMRAILVKSHQETFAIPLGAVKQIVRLDPNEMDWIGKDQVLRMGNSVYPIFSLGKVLNLKQPADESGTRRPVLILDVGGKQVAILADHLVGGREIVLKNLGNHLRRVPNLMGATLMGDGSVVLILDPVELVRDALDSRAPTRPAQLTPIALPRDTWTILLADDSPSVRRVLSTLIKNAGWKAITAKDGLEALEILHHSATTPDLVLLDVEMPRMDGYELLATLKAHEAYNAIPAIMVTSRAGDKHRRKALDLGASGYVVKPYQDEALLNVIRHLIREARSKRVVHV